MKLTTTLLGIMLLISILFGQMAQAMPKEICIVKIRSIYTSTVQARLRAALYQYKNGKDHYKGDLHPANYTKVTSTDEYDEATCFSTQALIYEFNKKKVPANDGYFLTNVRIDVKRVPDCQLSGDEGWHPWITAPRSKAVYVDLVLDDIGLIKGKCPKWGE